MLANLWRLPKKVILNLPTFGNIETVAEINPCPAEPRFILFWKLLIQIRWLLTKPSDQGPHCVPLIEIICLQLKFFRLKRIKKLRRGSYIKYQGGKNPLVRSPWRVSYAVGWVEILTVSNVNYWIYQYIWWCRTSRNFKNFLLLNTLHDKG